MPQRSDNRECHAGVEQENHRKPQDSDILKNYFIFRTYLVALKSEASGRSISERAIPGDSLHQLLFPKYSCRWLYRFPPPKH